MLMLYVQQGAAQVVLIQPLPVTIPFYRAEAGSALTPVQIRLSFYGDRVTDTVPLRFRITGSTNPALVRDSQLLQADPAFLVPADFTRTAQQRTVTVAIPTSAVLQLARAEHFDLEFESQAAGDPAQRIVVNPDAGQGQAANFRIYLLNRDTTVIAPLVSDKTISEQRRMLLIYRTAGVLQKDSTVALELVSNEGATVKPTLRTEKFTIRAEDTRNGPFTDTVPVYFDIAAVKDFGSDEFISLKMKGDDRQSFALLTRQVLFNPSRPFWLEAGANFDLIDGLRANNFYKGVFFYKRDIGNYAYRGVVTKKDRHFNLSILAGIYESRSVSGQSSDTTLLQFKDGRSMIPDTANRYSVFRDTGAISLTTTVNSLGLFFSPQVKLTRKDANADGFHVFASLWFEIIWQHINTKYDYTKMSNLSTLKVNEVQLSDYEKKVTETNLDYRSQYIGLGLPMYIKEGEINLYCQPTIGMTNQGFALVSSQAGATNFKQNALEKSLPHRWNLFFVFMFRLSEDKYGFAFTGEVRGLILPDVKPTISLALSKKFDLSKLLEYK